MPSLIGLFHTQMLICLNNPNALPIILVTTIQRGLREVNFTAALPLESTGEKMQDYLAHEHIKWQFNLSRAAWWGGQFERLIGLVKTALNKTIGKGLLTWAELCEVVLDVEIALNNRPLCYLEDDIQLPVLTPNSLLFLRSNQLPDLEPHHLEEVDLRR